MNRTVLSRIERLEAWASIGKGYRPWHRIIADSDEEAFAKQAALVASGEAAAEDNFIHHIIISPPPRPEYQT